VKHRKKWPDEALVFDDSETYGPESIFIGTDINKKEGAIIGINENGYCDCRRWVKRGDINSDLKPLTPAARIMLAIVRGER
jgi:hypothetical protein